MKHPLLRLASFCTICLAVTFAQRENGVTSVTPRFEVSFPASLHPEPITGRVFVALAKKALPAPIEQAGSWTGQAPFFGVDVDRLAPGSQVVIDSHVLGYPANSLEDVPAGDYYVQAIVNVYTEFHRSDGHVIWAHMDQWEGQHFNRSPGNLVSEVRRIHLDPAAGYNVKLALTKVIPPVEVAPDTAWVKHVKIQSRLLTEFWGHPMYLGATVLLPKDYDERPGQRYPVIYSQGHFNLAAPFGFRTTEGGNDRERAGFEFYKQWSSDNFPRVIAVTFQHPTPTSTTLTRSIRPTTGRMETLCSRN